MAYPSKGEWEFRNTTQGINFWPTLESIDITDGNPEDNATFSCSIVDPAASIDFEDEDQIWVKFGGVKIFAGHVKTCGFTYMSEAGPRVYQIEAQDYTAKLDDSVIDHPKSRGSEDLDDRVAWVLSFLNYSITTAGVNLPSVTSEKAEYDGMTVREALEQLADEHRLSFYVDYEKDLHLFRDETITAPFELNDDDPDYAASFPYTEWTHTLDSVELNNAVYVQGDKHTDWVTDGASIATYGRQERSINDSELTSTTRIQNAGLRALAENKDPQIDGSLVCREPGLQSGMTFGLTNDLWASRVDGAYIITSVTIEAVDPHDSETKAYLKCTVEYSDRRRARPYKRPTRKPEAQETADGDPITLDRKCFSANRDRIGAGLSGSDPTPIADTVSYDDVPPGHDEVVEKSPSYRRSYLASDCPAGFQGGHTGFLVEEQWFEFDPGDLDGVVSIRFTFDVSDENNVDDKELWYGYMPAADGPPVHEDLWTYLGRMPIADGSRFDVPASVLTPSVTNYVCIVAGWQSSRGASICDDGLLNGLEGSLGGISPGGGEFNSGSVEINSVTAVERILDGAGLTPWARPEGDIDGVNREYILTDWSGKGVPEVRIGGIIYAVASDYDYDADDGTITMSFAPWAGAVLEARWRQ